MRPSASLGLALFVGACSAPLPASNGAPPAVPMVDTSPTKPVDVTDPEKPKPVDETKTDGGSTMPIDTALTPMARPMASGDRHTCAIKAGELYCWGDNSDGQLGIGDQGSQASPAKVAVANVVGVSAGTAHTCAWTTEGKVYCWGDNQDGRVGVAPTPAENPDAVRVPTLANVSDIVQVAIGGRRTCALDSKGNVTCWGAGQAGQLGDGSTDNSYEPRRVVLANVVELAGGYAHACARTRDNAVHCWGNNHDGALGTGDDENSSVPRRVVLPDAANTDPVASLVGGDSHMCAALKSGALFCWGNSLYGKLAAKIGGDYLEPTRSAAIEVASASAGRDHTCVVSFAGNVYCFGTNMSGELGVGTDGNLDSTKVPTLVTGVAHATVVAAGVEHTCVLDEPTAQAFCWGGVALGDGVDEFSGTPVRVGAPF